MNQNCLPAAEDFSDATLARFLHAVDVNDVVDPEVALPDPIELACDQERMRQGLALCIAFWQRGVIRTEAVDLVHKLLRGEVLSADEQLRYKHIRARYKQLRFAQRLYGVRHRVDRWLQLTVVTMGELQDAFRGHRRGAVIGYGLALRLLLTRPAWRVVRWQVGRLRLDTADGFLAYRKAELQRVRVALQHELFAGREFHALRKIVSRQVSFYDAQRSLVANAHDYRMSRFLSAINGLMGAQHDDMVAHAHSGYRTYRTPLPLDADLRRRLTLLVDRWPK